MSSEQLNSFDKKVIRGLELDLNLNTATVIMCNPDIAKKMLLLDGIDLLGFTLRVSSFIETKYEENTYKGAQALANSADLSAKSAAVAYAALQSIATKAVQEKSELASTSTGLVPLKNTDISVLGSFKNVSLNKSDKVQFMPYEVIKVMNIIDKAILYISDDEYSKMKNETRAQFEKFGKILDFKFIHSRKNVVIGAELGSLFVEYSDIKSAEEAYHNMKSKKYGTNQLKLAFIPREAYHKQILNKK